MQIAVLAVLPTAKTTRYARSRFVREELLRVLLLNSHRYSVLRLFNRDRHTRRADIASPTSNLLIFKCQYGLYLKPLGLQKELIKLLRQLPLEDAFLQELRTVIAHPVSNNLFLSAHRYNFVLPPKRGSG